MNKEIEYSKEVPSLEAYHKTAKELDPKKQAHLVIERTIYKNDSPYFVKLSKERGDGGDNMVFSLKEDLLKQGIASGMKEAKEVDMEIQPAQLDSIVAILEILGYKEASQFKKERWSYY